jgi:hypothetical protein
MKGSFVNLFQSRAKHQYNRSGVQLGMCRRFATAKLVEQRPCVVCVEIGRRFPYV